MRTPEQVIILNQCPAEYGHSKCRISYYKKNGREKEVCFCSCHEHAKPPKKEPEPTIGISSLMKMG
jgi:hypothetical protein